MAYLDLFSLSPLLILGGTVILVLLMITIHRNISLVSAIALGGLGAAYAALFVAASHSPRQVTALLIVDGFTLFYQGLVIAISLAIGLLSFAPLSRSPVPREEFYLLLLLATLGSSFLVASSHLASFFLGLETMSISLYALIGYQRTENKSVEAAIKYLVLNAASSATLLFGMALLYGAYGTMSIVSIFLQRTAPQGSALLIPAGLGLMTVGLGFKLALVPFHMWAPDVYQGAPAAVSAFIATVSKASVFAVLLRVFYLVDISHHPTLLACFSLIAALSMFVGNLLALLQDNLKRILAYSSIAHMGYLLLAFLNGRSLALEAVGYYLVAYSITNIIAFGVLIALSCGMPNSREAQGREHYRGLFWQRPWLAALLTASLLSLAGIPLTMGFVAKLYVLATGVDSNRWALVLSLVVSSAIGLFYYLRIIVAMFAIPATMDMENHSRPRVPRTLGVTLGVSAFLLIGLGVFPGSLQNLQKSMVIAPNRPHISHLARTNQSIVFGKVQSSTKNVAYHPSSGGR